MVRCLIFDLGNVLVRFSHEKACKQLAKLVGTTGEVVWDAIFEKQPSVSSVEQTKSLSLGVYSESSLSSSLSVRLETGVLSPQAFVEELKSRLGYSRHIAIDDIKLALSDIFEPIVEMIAVVWRAKSLGMRLVLLSNTNVWHIEFIRRQWDFLSCFDECILSHQVGAVKPANKIYEAALAAAKASPGECFYTDDIEEYIVAGRKHGIPGTVYLGHEQYLNALQERGLDLSALR